MSRLHIFQFGGHPGEWPADVGSECLRIPRVPPSQSSGPDPFFRALEPFRNQPSLHILLSLNRLPGERLLRIHSGLG